LVAAKAKGGEPGVAFVVELTVAEFCQARACSTGDDLVERVKRIEGPGSESGVGIAGPSERSRSRGVGHSWRDRERNIAGSLEISRRRWSQLVVRLDVLIHRVAVNDKGIAEDFVIHRDITAIALRRRK